MNLVYRVLGRYYRWANRRFAVRPIVYSGSQAIVSFCFDEFPRSAYEAGVPILEKYVIRGTFFTSMGFAGDETGVNPKYMLSVLRDLVSRGHEIGCHTYGHELSQRVTSRTYEQSLDRNRERASEVLGESPWQSFAYPAGSITPSTKRMVASRFRCGRGISPGINRGTIDANALLANSIYSLHYPLEHYLDLINEVVKDGGWLIFYTHDVDPNPGPYGCSPEYLDRIAAAASGTKAMTLTINEALDYISGTETS
ncbi:MAG: polysaccharide deacetylase family protein [Aeoliella sp.]